VSYSIEIYANRHPIPEQCTNPAKKKGKAERGLRPESAGPMDPVKHCRGQSVPQV